MKTAALVMAACLMLMACGKKGDLLPPQGWEAGKQPAPEQSTP